MSKNKGYDSKLVEEKWRKYWEKEKIYKFDSNKKGKVFSVDTDPPTVSGAMHIGHAAHYSQEDFIARFFRMKGMNVLFPFGTDDNGLPTERLVEKLKKVKSKEMPRNEFVKLCLKTIKEIRPEFIQDWKNLGMSCDFNLSYSTIDDNSRKISQESFLDLYSKGLISIKEFPTIWCPECQTSIAQAELEDKEINSQFNTIVFKVGEKDLLIATTRPELIGACVAIFVNPKDKRYKDIVGKKARLPIFEIDVPIIADKSAEIEKGTGAMMICSYGDKYDVDAIARHKLEPRVIFNKKGEIIGGEYKGLKVRDARKKILSDLRERGLVKDQKQITHAVNVHDKCGTAIEFLPAEQYFIKILDKKKIWLDQGKKISWKPEFMFKRYENWVKGLEWDWNISRERHFGVAIPVWKCEKCEKIILAKKAELPVDSLETKKRCPKCKGEAIGESKVLDTWATSSLTPQIVLSLVKNKVKLPYSLRPQAHDIIRTWAFYTVVKSYLHERKLPWENIVISGFVKLEGEKMSKSKGNVIDPKEVMNKFGADATRYWAASSKLGEDINYQEKELIAGKRLVNKLINASRFVFMNLKSWNGKKPKKFVGTDSLFLKKLNVVIDMATKHFENYEYSKARLVVEEFFWKSFADNYIELVKYRIYNEKGDKKISAQYSLYHSLFILLKMFAPIVPFVAEEIYQDHFKKFEKAKSIHLMDWPVQFGYREMKDNSWGTLEHIISQVRKIKSEHNKSVKAEIVLHLDESIHVHLKDVLEDLRTVTNAKEIKTGKFKVEFV